MVKDYFQDITPPSDEPRPAGRESVSPQDDSGGQEIPIRVSEAAPAPRGIRNIPSPVRQRPSIRPRIIGAGMRPAARAGDSSSVGGTLQRSRRYFSSFWMWAIAAVSLAVVATLLLLVFRSTTVTITPKSHAITFNDASQYTAYPKATAAQGTLSYTVDSSPLEDSEVVSAQGITHVENKASGSVTVFNDYSATSVRLIKNTRFATPSGLIFKVPADVVVPGKKGAAPGSVHVTVVADAAGEKYNVAPSTFTLPGLKTTPDMYAHVYAKSSAAMTGGLIGDQPGMAPGAEDAARALVRSRLQSKANEASAALESSDVLTLPAAEIVYQDLPNTTEAGGGVRIRIKATVKTLVFPMEALAQTVARGISADADTSPMTLLPGDAFSIAIATSSQSALEGTEPLTFKLAGTAELVWKVDSAALAKALAGRDQGAFQTIVNGFPGIQEAHARIEPFWKRGFPSDPTDIKITIVAPAAKR